MQYLQVTQEWPAPLVISSFSRDWWVQNRPFTDQNQISVMGTAAVNGSHVGGCRRGGPPVTTLCHFSLMASSPQTSESSRCNLQSFSSDLEKWKPMVAVKGRAETEKRASNLLSPCIYLSDTLNSAGPAENHPSSAKSRQNPNASGSGKDVRLKSTWLIG